jgi:glutathione synthase/RimK-type ligase-like ATP-grasp enzyme
MFFLKCKNNKIATPDTILLSENFYIIKKELENFGHWPVILKRIRGCSGTYVEKADNPEEALDIIKKFWKEGSERLPVIAQEFVPSLSYRVTVIGKKIMQTAIKESPGWKHTGVSSQRFKKLKIDKDLKRLIDKTTKVMKINVCGIDLLKKNNQWLLLEVNSSPGLGFFDNGRQKLAEEIMNFLIKQ